MTQNTKKHINTTGKFEIGGPHGDAGLTGCKIIVDTYGGYARQGGEHSLVRTAPKWKEVLVTWQDTLLKILWQADWLRNVKYNYLMQLGGITGIVMVDTFVTAQILLVVCL